jgi:manganese oxidase
MLVCCIVVGVFPFYCQVSSHMFAGMNGLYTVLPPNDTFTNPVPIGYNNYVDYFIAAEEVVHDYAAGGMLVDDAGVINPSAQRNDPTILYNAYINGPAGSIYRKARYVEYTDETFTTVKPIPQAWDHKGVLGPVIRAIVGQTIRVRFLNRLTFPCNLVAGGALSRSSYVPIPGTSLNSTTNVNGAVAAGANISYHWPVYEESGPLQRWPDNPDQTIAWGYHSDVDRTHVNAGLAGVVIITGHGNGTNTPSGVSPVPRDVDREFVMLFQDIDENLSPFAVTNFASLSAAEKVASSPHFTFYYV